MEGRSQVQYDVELKTLTCLPFHVGTSPIPAHQSRFEIQTLLDFLSAAVDMQQWQFFPALMKLARSGLSDIVENDFEVNVVDDTEVDIGVGLDNRMSFLL